MNISQIVEGVVGKNVMKCEQAIMNNDTSKLQDLNDDIIKNLNNDQYYNDVNELINKINKNELFKNRFINNVKEHGLVIEAPSFSQLNIKNIVKNSKDLRETILIKKECLQYIKDKMKVDIPFPMQDIEIKNIFCAPIYTMRLHKIAKDVLTSRDLGKYKFITKQPLKGKANEGGSRLGQMEAEALIGHGCTKALKELFTVKSDCLKEKSNLIEQLITNGEYKINKNIGIEGGTRKVVQTLVKFLKD